jgi:hypothetical protein
MGNGCLWPFFPDFVQAQCNRRISSPRTLINIEDRKLHRPIRWPGILQQMIDIALNLFHLGAQLYARLCIQLQQDRAELARCAFKFLRRGSANRIAADSPRLPVQEFESAFCTVALRMSRMRPRVRAFICRRWRKNRCACSSALENLREGMRTKSQKHLYCRCRSSIDVRNA